MPYVHTADRHAGSCAHVRSDGPSRLQRRLEPKTHTNIGRNVVFPFPAGLGLAMILGCGAFAAACGSSVATAATIGRVAIPEMNELGYDKRISTGTVAAGGTLGILISPSIILASMALLPKPRWGLFAGRDIAWNLVGLCVHAGLIIFAWRDLHWFRLRKHTLGKSDFSH